MSLINPDWVDPIESTFDEGKPIRQEQGLMMAGNPIAMAAGKPGAPRIARKFLTGLSSSAGTSTSVTFTDIDGWGGLIVHGVQISLDDDAYISFSDDGSAFVSETLIEPFAFYKLDFSTGEFLQASSFTAPGITTGTISGIPSGLTDVRFTAKDTGGGVSINVLIELTGGDTAV